MYLRYLLRAMCSNLSAGLRIFVTCNELRPGKHLAQVRIEPPKDRADLTHLFVFAMAVKDSEIEAMDDALHQVLGHVQRATEDCRPGTCSIYDTLSRELAIKGGPWEEEHSRGHKRRAGSLLGRNIPKRTRRAFH